MRDMNRECNKEYKSKIFEAVIVILSCIGVMIISILTSYLSGKEVIALNLFGPYANPPKMTITMDLWLAFIGATFMLSTLGMLVVQLFYSIKNIVKYMANVTDKLPVALVITLIIAQNFSAVVLFGGSMIVWLIAILSLIALIMLIYDK